MCAFLAAAMNDCGQRVGHLLVVDKHLDLVTGEEAVLGRDVLRCRIHTVHDVGLQPERRHVVRAGGLQHVVGHRFRGGHRRVRVRRLERCRACSHGSRETSNAAARALK